ncbi:MAG TPA: pentapeptide repeat-containing protein [Thermoanaerobaculia bacterium]|nr:pentapeptide repeat-containing protein [Thermoanaerobaculia bacterium]
MPNVPTAAKRRAPRKKAESAESNVLSSDRFRSPRILRNKEMSYAQLAECDLAGSDFFGTNLVHANFRASRLIGVNFTQANLRFAVFEGADMTDAVLVDAAVQGAHFEGAAGLSSEQLARLEKRGAIVRNSEKPPSSKLAS